MSLFRVGGAHPTPVQEALLEAALSEGPEAIAAFRRWRALADVDRLDPATLQVLPRAYRNLRNSGLDDPFMGRFAGIYRLAWTNNQWLVSRSLPLIRALRERDIPVVILKGLALNVLYGRSVGVRRIGDVDLLVPADEAIRAVETARGIGWTSREVAVLSAEYLTVWHGVGLGHPGGGDMDLHWRLFNEDSADECEEALWTHAGEACVGGVPVGVPHPTELLLHVCVHGWAWCPHPPFRWVMDALTILRHDGARVDWDRLVAEAERRGLEQRLGGALRYLRDRFDADVPAAALSALSTSRSGLLDRLDHHFTVRPPPPPLDSLTRVVLHFRRLGSVEGIGRGPLGFVEYLRRRWGLQRRLDVPVRAAREVVKHSGRLVRRVPDASDVP